MGNLCAQILEHQYTRKWLSVFSLNLVVLKNVLISICRICVYASGVLPLIFGVYLTFTQTLRLGLIVVGVSLLLVIYRTFSINFLFISLLIIFSLYEFFPDFSMGYLIGRALIVAAFLCVLFLYRIEGLAFFEGARKRADNVVAIIGLAMVVVFFTTAVTFGDYHEYLDYEIQTRRLVDLILPVLVFFVVSKIQWNSSGWFSLTSLCVGYMFVFSVIFATGCVRTAMIYYNRVEAVKSFAGEEYADFEKYENEVQELNDQLRIENFFLDEMQQDFSSIAEDNDDPFLGYMALGDMCASRGRLDIAIVMYESAMKYDSDSNNIKWKLGDAYHASDRFNLALAAYGGIHQAKLCPRCYLGSGVILAQRITRGSANLDGALIMFKRYLDNKKNIYIKPESGIEFFSVNELFDEVMQGYINKLYSRDIVVLLQRLGWPVIFSPTQIGQTRVDSPVDILAFSAGQGNWNLEKILVNGHDESPSLNTTDSGHRRGINLVVIEPIRGDVIARKNFDIWGSKGASDMLAEFISDIPDSMIVAVTVRGEAGRFFSGRARRSLRKIGATRSPGINWSHAIIGLKGASPGQAIEAISPVNHVVVGTLQKGGLHFDTDEQIKMALKDSLEKHPEIPAAVYVGASLTESIVAIRGRKSIGYVTD